MKPETCGAIAGIIIFTLMAIGASVSVQTIRDGYNAAPISFKHPGSHNLTGQD